MRHWSDWVPLSKSHIDPIPDTPGVYMLRCVDETGSPIKIPRVGGVDRKGWLDIGETKNLNALPTAFKKWTFDPSMHSVFSGWCFSESDANRFLPTPQLHGVYSFHDLSLPALVG